jgi:Fe2+ or Zn2+ uptake regulation protein
LLFETLNKEEKMESTQISPRTVYHNLRLLEQVDVAKSALYRQSAQEVLADPTVSLTWRQAIANRLNHANHLLEMRTAKDNDSY